MQIRPATAQDIPMVATLSVAAFMDDELYEAMCPHRARYPSHFRAAFLNRFQGRFWSSNFVFLIAETDKSNKDWSGAPQIVGYAVWCRRGKSEIARRWRNEQNSFRGRLEGVLLDIESCYSDLIRADKSLDYRSRSRLREGVILEFEDLDEMWKLHNLAVDPNFQRRGIASMLIAWGQEQARKEGVCIGLIASTVGQELYRKNGFHLYGVIPSKILYVPMMIWEPEGKEGAWGVYQDGKEKGL